MSIDWPSFDWSSIDWSIFDWYVFDFRTVLLASLVIASVLALVAAKRSYKAAPPAVAILSSLPVIVALLIAATFFV